jgi:tetratricopeptide (TPR) repeat protein
MLDAKGDHEGAIKCYDTVLQIDPENISALVNKGVSLEKLNKNDEAIKCYEKALEIDPDHENARKNLDILLDKLNAQLK